MSMPKSSTSSTSSSLSQLIECFRQLDDPSAMVHAGIGILDDDHHRTIVALTDLPAQTCIMKIPLILMERTVTATAATTPFLLSVDSKLALSLLIQRRTNAILRRYWETLPKQITLPRDHPSMFDPLLEGSPVLRFIQHERVQIQQEYLKLQDYVNHEETGRHYCCTWEEFKYAMAVVSSRAFAVLPSSISGGAEGVALIPILDLCNHARGVDATAHRRIINPKNVTYQFVDNTTTATSVVATTTMNISQGDTLTITYGAQSNGALLCNYGFCQIHNIEPDESSNDTLEWNTTIFLRTGPKSYTFGPLIQVLETFRPHNPTHDENDVNDDDDMEVFLNECENDVDETSMDEMYGSDTADELLWDKEGKDDNDADAEQANGVVDYEIGALQAFANECTARLDGYYLKGQELSKLLAGHTTAAINGSTSQYGYNCAILIQSERRILQFFRHVAIAIIAELQILLNANKTICCHTASMSSIPWQQVDDVERIERQANELLCAYMQIRHPGWQPSAL